MSKALINHETVISSQITTLRTPTLGPPSNPVKLAPLVLPLLARWRPVIEG